jgi:hypothetical protein
LALLAICARCLPEHGHLPLSHCLLRRHLDLLLTNLYKDLIFRSLGSLLNLLDIDGFFDHLGFGLLRLVKI